MNISKGTLCQNVLFFFKLSAQQEVTLVKSGGPLGLSIVGGSDHASHPFGVNEPGVFISKVKPCRVPNIFFFLCKNHLRSRSMVRQQREMNKTGSHTQK